MDRDGPNTASTMAIGGSRGRAAVAAEVLGLLLMLLASAGTCALLIAAHRRVAPEPSPPILVAAAPAVEATIDPEPIEPAPIPPEPEPEPEPAPPPEPEVAPTAEALAQIDAERAALAEEAGRTTRVLAGLGRELEATGEAIERSLLQANEAGRRRAVLVAEAEKLEAEAQLVGLERDVLERRKGEAERQLRERVERPGYAILPYRGPSGTWRRPIPVECRDGTARLEPGGMSFSMVELLAMPGRPGPFGAAVKRLAALLESQGAPGGEGVEAYVLFVVRPDGIRPFYEARSALDANGVPYGYELVDQDWEIEYPAWDDPTIWDSLDAAMQDPAALADMQGDGMPAGLPGSRGPLGGDGTFPPRPPGPGEMVDALRGLDDLYPGGGADPNGLAGAGLGGRGPGGGSLADEPGGGGFGGEGDGFGGRSGVIPILPEGAPDPGFAGGSTPDRPGDGPGDGAADPGGPGLIPVPPGGPALGAGGVPGRPGGEAAGLGGRGEVPVLPEGSTAPGLAGNGRGASGDPTGTGTGPGGGHNAATAGTPAGSGPIGPGPAGHPGAGGTGVGWQDGGPDPSAAGGLGQIVGGLVQSLGSGIGGGTGGGGSDADGGGGTAGTPGGQAGGSSLAGSPGGMASPGLDGGPGGSVGGDFGSGPGAAVGTFELVVACGRNGATIHPGGYRIGTETLKTDPSRLARTLRDVVEAARRRGPATARMPSVRFLVEPAGRDAYWLARGQVELAGLGWPTSWQASQPRTFTIFGSERW